MMFARRQLFPIFASFLLVAGALSACSGGGGGDSCGGILSPNRVLTPTATALSLDVGEQATVAATLSGGCPNDAQTVTWQSGTPSVATVSSAGQVVALTPGTSIITGTAFDNKTRTSITVTVKTPAVKSITLSATTLALFERKTATLSATVVTTGQLSRRVSFTSSAPTIATVASIDSVSATITAVAPGTADIDVVSQSDASIKATARVTVNPALVATVTLTGVTTSDSIVLGGTRQITATLRDDGGVQLTGRTVTYQSLSPAIATVSSTGLVRAVSAGDASISATVPVGDGTSATRTASVTARAYGTIAVALSPKTLTLQEGQGSTIAATVTGTAGIDRTLIWETSDVTRATVTSAGAVTAVTASASPVYIRARLSTVPNIVDSIALTVITRSVVTSIDIGPAVDTLFPNGVRNLIGVVRDQRAAVIAGAPVVWRSLTPALASVTAAGKVTALATGTAKIVGTTPKSVGVDSLSDTTTYLIAPPCSLVRPFTIGSTYQGTFDASSCTNFLGFNQADQFSLTSATQIYYSLRLTPTIGMGLTALNIGSGFYGDLVNANQTVETFGVMRAGTFGFMVANQTTAPGSYTVTSTLNPDPRLSCVTTDVTRGVTFQTAVTPSCQRRDIRILPAYQNGTQVTISATAASFSIRIELHADGSDALLATATASQTGGTATMNFVFNSGFAFAHLRVIGGPIQNDLVTITIGQ